MSTCLICLDREADATGSHILPHSILESMYNASGVKGRDKEQNFSIGSKGSKAFMGRKVLPETIEETLGRPLTDEEIANQENPYVADHIFCQGCEDSLAYLESLYSREVALPLAKGQKLTEK